MCVPTLEKEQKCVCVYVCVFKDTKNCELPRTLKGNQPSWLSLLEFTKRQTAYTGETLRRILETLGKLQLASIKKIKT